MSAEDHGGARAGEATATAEGPARLVSRVVAGPVGDLEALIRVPANPRGAAVVAHPHPLHGGTMHTKVVHRAAKLLSDSFSLLALRFNFRGVGASAGTHDEGRGEVDDLIAAARFARHEEPRGPFVLSGFSFGSVCAMKAAATIAPAAVLVMGLPLDRFAPDSVSLPAGLPVVWIQGEEDEFGAGPRAREVAKRLGFFLWVIPGADHFFTARLEAFEAAAIAGLSLFVARGV